MTPCDLGAGGPCRGAAWIYQIAATWFPHIDVLSETFVIGVFSDSWNPVCRGNSHLNPRGICFFHQARIQPVCFPCQKRLDDFFQLNQTGGNWFTTKNHRQAEKSTCESFFWWTVSTSFKFTSRILGIRKGKMTVSQHFWWVWVSVFFFANHKWPPRFAPDIRT